MCTSGPEMTYPKASFAACEICGARTWTSVRRGPIRDGTFGNRSGPEAEIAQCSGCSVQRLDEASCTDAATYETAAYREKLQQATNAEGFFDEHDIMQLQNLSVLWPDSVRGQVIADIGSAAGSFLDHVHGLTETAIAIEPFTGYHDSLRARGYQVFQYTHDAAPDWTGRIDRAFSFSVLEHVDNPRLFLSEIATLLTENGELILSTPNRRDALMDLLPITYPAFFYRSVHRWYFDVASLAALAEHAGLIVRELRCVHRYGLSNALRWIRDQKPGGREALPHIDARLDAVWQRHLEAEGASDYIYARLSRQ